MTMFQCVLQIAELQQSTTRQAMGCMQVLKVAFMNQTLCAMKQNDLWMQSLPGLLFFCKRVYKVPLLVCLCAQ